MKRTSQIPAQIFLAKGLDDRLHPEYTVMLYTHTHTDKESSALHKPGLELSELCIVGQLFVVSSA